MSASPSGHRHVRWTGQIGLWLLVFLTAFLFLMSPGHEGQTAAVFILGSTLLALGWFGWSAFSRLQPAPDEHSLGSALLIFIVVLGLTACFSNDPALSLNAFTISLSLGMLFWIAFWVSRNHHSLRVVLGWLSGLAVLLAAYGLFQTLGGLEDTCTRYFGARAPAGEMELALAQRLQSGRAFSLFAYPNLLAGFLAAWLPLTASLAWLAQRRWLRWLLAAGAAVMLAGLAATQSIGGWIAAAAGLAVWFWLQNRRPGGLRPRQAVWIWAAGLVLMAGGAAWLIHVRGWALLSIEGAQRLSHWKSALAMFRAHPVTGVGLGLFGSIFPDYQLTSGYYVRFAHNYFLNLLAETGLLGGAALAWLFWKIFQHVRAGFRRCSEGPRRSLLAGLAAAVIAAGLHALVDVDLHFIKNAAFFWLLLGMLAGLSATPLYIRLPRKAAPPPAAPMKSRWLELGLALVLTVVLWRGGRSLPVECGIYWGTAGVLVIFFIKKLTEFQPGWKRWLKVNPVLWPLGALSIWGVLCSLVSPHPAAAISGLCLGLIGIFFFWVILTHLTTPQFLIHLLSWSAALLGAVAGVQAWLHPGMRATAGWPNPNLLAAFLAMGLLMTWAFLFGYAVSTRERLAAWGRALVILMGLLATGSLAGLLNLAAGLAVWGIWLWKRRPEQRRIFGMSLLVVGAVILILPMSLGQRLSQLGQYSGQAYERAHIAQAALKMAGARPITGFGPGNFAEAFSGYSFPNVRGLARYGKQAPFAHNEWLQILAVMGIPGLLLLFWLMAMVGIQAKRKWLQMLNEKIPIPAASLNIGIWAALAGACAQALADFNWHLPALLLWGLVLLGLGLGRIQMESKIFFPADLSLLKAGLLQGFSWLQKPAVILLLLFVMVAASAATRLPLSQYFLDRGQDQQYKNSLKAAAFEFQKALMVHPLSSAAYDHLGQTQADFYATTGDEHWFHMADWALHKALALDQLDPFIHRHFGQLYSNKAVHSQAPDQQKYYDLAIGQYLLGIEKAPHQAFLFFELGNLYRDMKNLELAEDCWKKSLELEPNYSAALSNLGVAQELRGDTATAEATYRRALELRKLMPAIDGKYEIELISLNWAFVHYNLAHLLEREGRWSEARGEYGEVLRLEPTNAAARRRWDILKKFCQ